jgi:hypothetical protein
MVLGSSSLIWVLALVGVAVVLWIVAMVWLRPRQEEEPEEPARAEDAVAPPCPKCGLKLMPLEKTQGPGFLCVACQIRFVPARPDSDPARFPEGYRAQRVYEKEPDAQSDGTFFGL